MDKRGSTAYPSRTSWGAAHSLAEKFPFLFERRFGIRAYDYWYGYTHAQIELMSVDVPIVVYENTDKKNATKREMDDLADQWYKNKGETFKKGEKINLTEYLNSKI